MIRLLLALTLTVDLTKAAADAFDRYIARIEAQIDARLHIEHFLAPTDSPEWRAQLRKGFVHVQPASGNGTIAIKNGLIQDWNGAVFIPGATLQHALSIVQDYEHHKDFYQPEIADAKIRARTGDDFQVHMRIVKQKLMIADVLSTEQEIHFTALTPHRVYSRAYSRKIAEVADPGKPGEHELAVGQDRGFLWRLYGYWFFEEADGGVYIACQSITLTRDLPLVLGKVLGPILRDLPGESVRHSLEQTRQAILRR